MILESRHFGISVLSDRQREVSETFAARSAHARFLHVPYHYGETGAPLLRDAIASLECSLWATYPGGDHTIFVGRAIRTYRNLRPARPLVHYCGEYADAAGRSFVSTGHV